MHVLPKMSVDSLDRIGVANHSGARIHAQRSGAGGEALAVTMLKHLRPLRHRVVISSSGASYSIDGRAVLAPTWESCVSSAPSSSAPF
jgi:hypothetical protein